VERRKKRMEMEMGMGMAEVRESSKRREGKWQRNVNAGQSWMEIQMIDSQRYWKRTQE